MAKSEEQVIEEFDEAVNMSRKELEDWLQSDEAKEVGQKDGGESQGHESGRRIVELLDKKKSDYTDDDIDHMRRVVSYVHRHGAQKPKEENVEDSKWRYSLMNWGHDPLK